MIAGFSSNLEKVIASEIAGLGFELIGLEFDNHNNPKVLRVYADILQKQLFGDFSGSGDVSSRGGITLDECGKISYYLNKFLVTLPNLDLGNYVLEVSSPGLERKLFNLLQFEQHSGKEVRFSLAVSFNGRSNFVGVLRSVDHALNRVFIEVDRQDLYFDFDNIVKANLIYRKL